MATSSVLQRRRLHCLGFLGLLFLGLRAKGVSGQSSQRVSISPDFQRCLSEFFHDAEGRGVPSASVVEKWGADGCEEGPHSVGGTARAGTWLGLMKM